MSLSIIFLFGKQGIITKELLGITGNDVYGMGSLVVVQVISFFPIAYMTLSGILMYINPTMQLLLSVALYGEAFTATHAILFGFVWTGLILYLISGARENRRHREEEKPCV